MLEDSLTLIEMIHGIVLTLSPEGKIVTFNSYLEDISGYKSGELRYMNWYELFVAINHRVASRENFQNLILEIGDERIVNKIQTRNNEVLFFEWNLKTIKDSNGGVIRILGVGQDITERVNNEGQLLVERSKLIERNKELTCLYGISQVFENAAISFDGALEATVRQIPEAFQHPEAAKAKICFGEIVISTQGYEPEGKKLSQEIVIRGEKRGTVEVVYPSKLSHSNQPGFSFLEEEEQLLKAVSRHLALIFEKNEAIAKGKELEAQIRHADRLATIGQLAAGIAHELNNPLGDILGFAQLAAKHPDIPDSADADIKRIVKSCLYAREIIKKVLFFSRQMPPQKTSVHLNDLVEEWMDVIDVHCQKNGIHVQLALNRKLPPITGDPFQLNQVLVNLVNNAIDAMPGGGLLTVTTRARNAFVTLEVMDTGFGMTEDVLKKIFTPFFTTKDVDRGTGLGLSVVHGIIETHGGSVHADSREGEGSVFTVTLPVTQEIIGNEYGNNVQSSV